ncbi:TraR/DksA family transcriptional regulator [Candidatus Laterigemmans baculatus]|uniref:TraR/DksA family transcriptional regulator n=1 Tax=Candidatus Laterigemmans baculatus TaxID=2770505 RepID=UPI0013DB6084|nr:TraR/DksA C4-type zinc finger protein [Candidatus Laterigemmans baculatus]
MPSKQTISPDKLEQFRSQLRDMRDRLSGEVERVVEAVRAELDTSTNLSSVPVHMSDLAPDQLDADINVIETEREMLLQIQDALHRLDAGTYGVCTDCGGSISQERLRAIPYTPYCIRCANKRS